MRRGVLIVVSLMAMSALAQQPSPVARVADDALVFDRIAEASKRDLPRDLLKRIVNEDIDLLRGKRTDGSFEYATWERFEAGRLNNSFSIQPREDKMQTVEAKGAWVYRVVIDVPERRLVVRKNRPVWIERVDADFVGEGSTQSQTQSFEVKAWLQPGEIKPIDLPVVARQATVKVIATADPKGGYGNVDVALVQAKIVDEPDSPYADAVSSAKAVQRALENGDIASIRTMAQRLRDSLGVRAAPVAAAIATPARTSVDVVAPATDTATRVELQAELQLIEDLLTGSETERRDGMDRLHQLVRRLRP